jgi:hypothetical protein
MSLYIIEKKFEKVPVNRYVPEWYKNIYLYIQRWRHTRRVAALKEDPRGK